MVRENFKSRIGFLLVSAGCAIGIGNVWKFPYVTGANGGGVFVLFYLIFLLIMGVPILTMEFAIGRASKKSIVGAYKMLEAKNTKWHIHGYICMLGCLILMMYYTTVSGWMLNYFFKFLTNAFSSIESVGSVFENMLGNPIEMTIFMVITVVFGIVVCSFGLQSGLEKVAKVMMSMLLILIVILACHSLTLSNAIDGVKFYLLPDFNLAKEVGITKIMTQAMNQSFFTLSLGVAAMEIFGSYMNKEYTLTSEAVKVCILDTFVALISGLIIFPACFSFGVNADAGPSLIFITLPRVFLNMPLGRIWGTLFFAFMTFASFSTVIAVFENLIAFLVDEFKMDRKKASIIWLILIIVLSMPCVLGYNVLSNVRFFGNKDVLDFEDFIVSNLLLPIGSLIFLLFCSFKFGWGFDKYIEECNTGNGLKLKKGFAFYFKFILPILILIIIIQGLK